MADTSNLTNFLGDIANAIRTKKETTEQIPAENFDQEILSIETGIDTSDATAATNDIISPQTAYVNGQKITGSIIPEYDVAETTISEVKQINLNGLEISEINGETGIVMVNTDSSTYSFYKINNDELDLQSRKDYTIDDLGSGTKKYFKFACKKSSDNTLVFCIIDTSSVITTGKINIDTLEITDITHKSGLDIGNVFSTLSHVGGTSNEFMSARPYWGSSNGVMYKIKFITIWKLENGETNYGEYTMNQSSNKAIDNTSFRFYEGTNDGLTMGAYMDIPGSNIGCYYYLTRSSKQSTFVIADNTGFSNNSKPFLPISDNWVLKDDCVYYKNDLSNKIMDFPINTSLRNSVQIITNTNFIVVGVDTNFSLYYVDEEQETINIQPISLTGASYSNALISSHYCYVYNPNSSIYWYFDMNSSTILVSLERDTIRFQRLINTTAESSNVLKTKSFYNSNGRQVGTMPNNGELNITPTEEVQNFPAGYYSNISVNADTFESHTEYQECLTITEDILS